MRLERQAKPDHRREHRRVSRGHQGGPVRTDRSPGGLDALDAPARTADEPRHFGMLNDVGRLVPEVVGTDDGRVPRLVAAREPALLDHADIGDAVVLRQVVGGGQAMAPAAHDHHLVGGLRLGGTPVLRSFVHQVAHSDGSRQFPGRRSGRSTGGCALTDGGLSFAPMSDDATVVERSRSVSRVGRILEILIAAKTIVACLALYWMVRELVALVHVRGTGNTEAPEIRAVVAAGRFVFVVNTPLLFATIFVWLIWQFFVHDLVARAAGSPFRFGRWASVGWWFVPFANLLMPYRVMQELWNKTDGLTSGSEDRRLLRWWVPWDAQVVLLY